LSSRSFLRPGTDIGQCLEAGSYADQPGRRQQLGQLGIDCLDPGADRSGGGTTPVGEFYRSPATVVGIVLALDVPAYDEGVDQLTGRLLGDPNSRIRSTADPPWLAIPPNTYGRFGGVSSNPASARRARMAWA